MQVIYKDKDKENNSGRADLMNSVLYIERIGRYIEREHIREFSAEIKKEFRGEEEESLKVAELKMIE